MWGHPFIPMHLANMCTTIQSHDDMISDLWHHLGEDFERNRQCQHQQEPQAGFEMKLPSELDANAHHNWKPSEKSKQHAKGLMAAHAPMPGAKQELWAQAKKSLAEFESKPFNGSPGQERALVAAMQLLAFGQRHGSHITVVQKILGLWSNWWKDHLQEQWPCIGAECVDFFQMPEALHNSRSKLPILFFPSAWRGLKMTWGFLHLIVFASSTLFKCLQQTAFWLGCMWANSSLKTQPTFNGLVTLTTKWQGPLGLTRALGLAVQWQWRTKKWHQKQTHTWPTPPQMCTPITTHLVSESISLSGIGCTVFFVVTPSDAEWTQWETLREQSSWCSLQPQSPSWVQSVHCTWWRSQVLQFPGASMASVCLHTASASSVTNSLCFFIPKSGSFCPHSGNDIHCRRVLQNLQRPKADSVSWGQQTKCTSLLHEMLTEEEHLPLPPQKEFHKEAPDGNTKTDIFCHHHKPHKKNNNVMRGKTVVCDDHGVFENYFCQQQQKNNWWQQFQDDGKKQLLTKTMTPECTTSEQLWGDRTRHGQMNECSLEQSPKLLEWVVGNDQSLISHTSATCRPLIGCNRSWQKGKNQLSVKAANKMCCFCHVIFGGNRLLAKVSNKWPIIADEWPTSGRQVTNEWPIVANQKRLWWRIPASWGCVPGIVGNKKRWEKFVASCQTFSQNPNKITDDNYFLNALRRRWDKRGTGKGRCANWLTHHVP